MRRRLVISKIVGGLGNQLFCYAAARRLALKNDATLCLDVNFFRADFRYGREYRLDYFTLPPHELLRSPRRLPALLDLYRWRLGRKLAIYGLPPGRDYFIESNPRVFEPRLLDHRVTRTTLLDGYWQDERYFADIAPVLRRDLAFRLGLDVRHRELAAQIGSSNSVAVHSRRLHHATVSDAIGATEALTARYYLDALEIIATRVVAPEFFCFSDDPRWIEKQWPRHLPVTFVHNAGANGDVADLWLMSQCRHFIIANSTFSWWGAWLGAASDKVVVAPRPKALQYEVRSATGWMEMDW